MDIGRLLRGIVRTSLTWAAITVPLSLIPFGVASLFGSPVPVRIWGVLLLTSGVMGLINGGVFATLLAIAGRRTTFERLSLAWIAACGALGGALVPFVSRAVVIAMTDVPMPATALVWTLTTNALLGAGFATVALSAARRAPALPRDLEETPALESSQRFSMG